MAGRDRSRVGLVGALAACAATLAGCLVEPQFPEMGSSDAPFAVTLTADKPVAVLDVEAVPSPAMPSGAHRMLPELVLHHVDPRVRVAIAPEFPSAELLGSVASPDSDGELNVVLTGHKTRIILELTEPDGASRVTVSGTVSQSFEYDGSPDPGAAVSFRGLDAPDLRTAPDVSTATTAGPPVVLDADHPVALVPMSVSLTQDGHLTGMASGTDVKIGTGIPAGAAVATVYSVVGFGPTAYAEPVEPKALLGSCQLGIPTPCGGPMVLRWQWTGLAPRVELAYDVETTLVGYEAPLGSHVETSFGEPIVVPASAVPVQATQEGTVKVDQLGGHVDVALALTGVPAAPNPEVLEVPGVLIATVSALGSGGQATSDTTVAIRFVDRGSRIAIFPSEMALPVDGVKRTIAVPVFAACKPGADCTPEVRLLAGAPAGPDVGGVVLAYRLDARATAFSGSALQSGASLTFTQGGPKQP